MASSTEPFLDKLAKAASTKIDLRAALGKPSYIQRFTWKDLGAVVVVIVAFTIAMLTAFEKGTAVHLGQTPQLIILGLMLSIMGACTQRQVQRMLFVYEAYAGSTLQNFDALLRTDYFSQEAEFRPQAILLVLFLLPLGLGASYKRFIGGSTTAQVPSVGGWYGMTAAPGYQRIGNGLSLLVNIYLPFWIDPANTNGTYGFNLFVPNTTVAAVLDAPLPTSLQQLQASLKGDESFELSAEVDATVSELNPIAPSERENATFWQDLENSFGNGFEDNSPSDLQGGAFTQMYTGSGNSSASYAEIYVSFYNITRNESFKSTAERYSQTRRKCHAAWNITQTSILLQTVTILQTGEEAMASEFQAFLFTNPLLLSMFSKFLGEYAPTIRAQWSDPLPYSNFTNPQYIPPVNTIPPLIAAMVWARIVSAYGAERLVLPPSDFAYYRDPSQITMQKEVVTVRRSAWLIFILAIHPILTTMAVLIKALLYTTPIGDGFGLVSLLAGIKQESLAVLRGAALSGKLERPVRVRFSAKSIEEEEYERLEIELDVQGRSDSLDLKKTYG